MLIKSLSGLSLQGFVIVLFKFLVMTTYAVENDGDVFIVFRQHLACSPILFQVANKRDCPSAMMPWCYLFVAFYVKECRV